MTEEKLTQVQLVFNYFQKYPNREIKNSEIVDWAVKEWKDLTGEEFRDPNRAIRTLHDQKKIIKVARGVYKYDPNYNVIAEGKDFPKKIKQKIFKRDNYSCVICGRGEADGMTIHADHIKPKSLGGTDKLENGQTLCSQHNFFKKNLQATTTGKKLFIRLYELSKAEGDQELEKFCSEILQVYEKHNINGHIEWKP